MSSNFEPLGLHTPTPEFYPESPQIEAANALLDEAGMEADADGIRASVVIDLIPYGEDWRRAGDGTDQIRPGTPFVNSTGYSNVKVDELLAAGAIEPDADARSEIYAEVSNILGEELPVVNLFEMEFLTVYNEKLKDHTVSAMGAYGSFDRAFIEE